MLEGIRVLDFSQYLPGPFATLRLVDRGAEVIKVEAPNGDPARQMADGALFAANNRGKKSIAIDLKSDEGRSKVYNLLKDTDVVVESFRPGVMDRLCLGYEEVKDINPDIIHLSLTGFGQNSPYSHQGSHDLNYVAMSGFLSQFKDESGRPVMPTQTVADLIGGMAASEAILSALFKRERTGEGSYIDLAMTDAIFSMMGNHAILSSIAGVESGIPVLNGSYANYRIYETKDGRFMALGALEYKFWSVFCQAVGEKQWLNDFPNQLKRPEIHADIERLFRTRDFQDWIKIGKQYDCCLFPVLEISEVLKDDYVNDRDLVHILEGQSFVQTSHHSLTETNRIAKLNEHADLLNLLSQDPKV